MTKQAQMFEFEDLPLFSGTAPRGQEARFDPSPTATQESMATCKTCLDTGKVAATRTVGVKFCWCKAGHEARAQERAKYVAIDAACISSGTLSNLTGLREYADIARVQAEFVTFCEYNAGHYRTWQEAWRAFEIKKASQW